MDFLIRRFNVDVRHEQRIGESSALVNLGQTILVATQDGLTAAERNEALALEMGRIVLGYTRENLLPMSRAVASRREFALLRWVACACIPDYVMHQAEQEEWTVERLMEEAEVTYRLAEVRMVDWMNNQRD